MFARLQNKELLGGSCARGSCLNARETRPLCECVAGCFFLILRTWRNRNKWLEASLYRQQLEFCAMRHRSQAPQQCGALLFRRRNRARSDFTAATASQSRDRDDPRSARPISSEPPCGGRVKTGSDIMRRFIAVTATAIGAAVLSASPISVHWSAGKAVSVMQDKANAEVGRPLTAGSVAGVNCRHDRRAVRRCATGVTC